MAQAPTPAPLYSIQQLLMGQQPQRYTPAAAPSLPIGSAPTTPPTAPPNGYTVLPTAITPASIMQGMAAGMPNLFQQIAAARATQASQPSAFDQFLASLPQSGQPDYDAAHGVSADNLARFGTGEGYGSDAVAGYTPIQTTGHSGNQLEQAEAAYKALPMHSPYREMAFQNGELQPTGAVKRKTGDSLTSAANDPVLHPGGIIGPELSGFGNEAAATARDIASLPISALERTGVLSEGASKRNAETARLEHQVAQQNGKVGAALGDLAVAAPLAVGGAALGGAAGGAAGLGEAGVAAARLAGLAVGGGGLPGAGEAANASIDANESGGQTAANALLGGATGSALGAITGGEGGALARTAFQHLPASVRSNLENTVFGSPELRQGIANARDRLAGATTDRARQAAQEQLSTLEKQLPAPSPLAAALASPVASNVVGGAAIMPVASTVAEAIQHQVDPSAFGAPDLSLPGLAERAAMGGINGFLHRGTPAAMDTPEPMRPAAMFPAPEEAPAPEAPSAPVSEAPAAPAEPPMPQWPAPPTTPTVDPNAPAPQRAAQVSDLIQQVAAERPPSNTALTAADIMRGTNEGRMTGGSLADMLHPRDEPSAPAEPVAEASVQDMNPEPAVPESIRSPEETAQSHINEMAAQIPENDVSAALSEVSRRREMLQSALENVQRRNFAAIPDELKHLSMNDISSGLQSARMMERSLNARVNRAKLPESTEEPGARALTTEQTSDLMKEAPERIRPVDLPDTITSPIERARVMTQVSDRYPAIEQRVRSIMVRGGIPESEMRPNRPFAGLPSSAVEKLAASRNPDVKHIAQIEQVARAMTSKKAVKERSYLRQVVRQLGLVSRKSLNETEQAGRRQGALPFDQAAGVAASSEAYNRELSEALGTPPDEPRDIITEEC